MTNSVGGLLNRKFGIDYYIMLLYSRKFGPPEGVPNDMYAVH